MSKPSDPAFALAGGQPPRKKPTLLAQLSAAVDAMSSKLLALESRPAPKDGGVGPEGPKGEPGERGQAGESIKGDTGPQGGEGPAGKDGATILSARLDEHGHGLLTLSTGTIVDLGCLRGAQGTPGERGEAGESIRGEAGPQGAEGPAGKDGATILSARLDERGHALLTLSTGAVVDLGCMKGERGEPGQPGESIRGEVGPQGPEGRPGESIVGPAGPAGPQGSRGARGERGPAGEAPVLAISNFRPVALSDAEISQLHIAELQVGGETIQILTIA